MLALALFSLVACNPDIDDTEDSGVVDTIPPDTTIDSAPPTIDGSAAATFTFSGTDDVEVVGFECSIDGGAYEDCTSPAYFPGLLDADHGFAVRAVDIGGNLDESPAIATWKVDTTEPDTSIVSGPTDPTSSTDATFEFYALELNGIDRFQCKLDTGNLTVCETPLTYPGLSAGAHTFEVLAIDVAGNTESVPAQWTWTIQ